MRISYFPSAFKTAKVIIIPKQDSTSLKTLSMLAVIGKCLEKIILNWLYSFKKPWFHMNRFDFTQKSNPQLALISLINHI